jgi:hypothetical protein
MAVATALELPPTAQRAYDLIAHSLGPVAIDGPKDEQLRQGAEMLVARGLAVARPYKGKSFYELAAQDDEPRPVPRMGDDSKAFAASQRDMARRLEERRQEVKRQEIAQAKADAFDQLARAMDLRLSPDGKRIYTGDGIDSIRADLAPMAAKALAHRWRRLMDEVRDFMAGPGEDDVRAAWARADETQRAAIVESIVDEAREHTGGELTLCADAVAAVLNEESQA